MRMWSHLNKTVRRKRGGLSLSHSPSVLFHKQSGFQTGKGKTMSEKEPRNLKSVKERRASRCL